jgi:hypothetical protein
MEINGDLVQDASPSCFVSAEIQVLSVVILPELGGFA